MPRFALALVLCASVPHGVAAIGASALAQNSELSRCLDPATILGAGGDVSDKELAAAQSACAQLKQSSTDRETLARINGAAGTIAKEMQRRQASAR